MTNQTTNETPQNKPEQPVSTDSPFTNPASDNPFASATTTTEKGKELAAAAAAKGKELAKRGAEEFSKGAKVASEKGKELAAAGLSVAKDTAQTLVKRYGMKKIMLVAAGLFVVLAIGLMLTGGTKEVKLTPAEQAEVERFLAEMPEFYPFRANPKATFFSGETLLHYAAEYGNLAVTKYGVSIGINVNAKNRHGRTPLHVAAWSPIYWERGGTHPEVIRFLISKGANRNAKDNLNGDTPLAYFRSRVAHDERSPYLKKYIIENKRIIAEIEKALSGGRISTSTPRAVNENSSRPTNNQLLPVSDPLPRLSEREIMEAREAREEREARAARAREIRRGLASPRE